MTWSEWGLLVLTTWYTSTLFVRESGPFKIFTHLRNLYQFAGAFQCIICFSFYAAAFWYMVLFRDINLMNILTIAAGASILELVVTH